MARTQVRGTQVEDGSIKRSDLDAVTAGEAVVRRLIAGSGITFSSTGPDEGTGDVTINATGGGGSVTIDRVEVDFGSVGAFSKTFQVTVSGISANQKVIATPSLDMPADVMMDELEMDPLSVAAHATAANTVTLIVSAASIITGKRAINIAR